MFKEIIIAFQSYIHAHNFIARHKLWRWIILPGIFYMILFVVCMYFFGKTSSWFIETISFKTGLQAWLEQQGSFLKFLFAFAGLMLWSVQMLLYFSLFKYIWLIIGSPVFAYLSEKTEAILEGNHYPFSFKQLAGDIVRGIRLALRNTLWQTFYSIILLILSIIPIVGWITPLAALLNECYYYGFSMIDYSCERRKMNVKETIVYVGKHKGLAVGNGIVFYLMHLVPFIGWVFAPSYAVIAATLSIYRVKAKPSMK